MKCSECEYNYLEKLLDKYIEENNGCLTTSVLYKFLNKCEENGDTRSAMSIINALTENNCEECSEYRKYYE